MSSTHSNLLAKLDQLSIQFTELEAQLVDPAVVSDPDKLRDLGIKR